MTLHALQMAFREQIAAADDALAPSSVGMRIYRDAYRGRLLAALETSFERTRRWVGAEAFSAAACHYILSAPPTGWTLDDYGADFPDLLAGLFAEDAEVAELAWLEWHMQRAFAAVDAPRVRADALAAAGYAPDDWANLCFRPAPGVAMRPIATNCAEIWHGLSGETANWPAVVAVGGVALLVWRQALSPRYRVIDAQEFDLLGRIAGGASFGQIATDMDPEALGLLLARWLSEELFSAATVK